MQEQSKILMTRGWAEGEIRQSAGYRLLKEEKRSGWVEKHREEQCRMEIPETERQQHGA